MLGCDLGPKADEHGPTWSLLDFVRSKGILARRRSSLLALDPSIFPELPRTMPARQAVNSTQVTLKYKRNTDSSGHPPSAKRRWLKSPLFNHFHGRVRQRVYAMHNLYLHRMSPLVDIH